MAGPSLDWERLPARVEAVIAERIGQLPERCRALLEAASVEGEEFTAEVAARVRGLDPGETSHCLSEVGGKQHRLVSAQRLQRVGGARHSRFRFRHQLFQKYLYHHLDPVERSSLHEAVGDALEALHGEQAAEIAVQLAWHFESAGLTDRRWVTCSRPATRSAALSLRRGDCALQPGPELARDATQFPERSRRELALQLALAVPLCTARGWETRKGLRCVRGRASWASRWARCRNSSRRCTCRPLRVERKASIASHSGWPSGCLPWRSARRIACTWCRRTMPSAQVISFLENIPWRRASGPDHRPIRSRI